MGKFGFADGVDVKPDFKEILMIQDISAIEDEGRFSHGLKNLFIIEIFVDIPFGHNGNGIAAESSLVRIFDKGELAIQSL